jgi:hypothetical protein
MKRMIPVCVLLLLACAPLVRADVLYSNLTVTDAMEMASRPGATGKLEIEAADDFVLLSPAIINQVTFIGLIAGGTTANVSDINVEAYRVFPNDSNVGRTSGPPTFSTPNVPTRVNSPSDVVFAQEDNLTGGLSCSSTVLATSFTAANSVLNGIHAVPNQTTGGEGPVTGQEVQFTCEIANPIVFPSDHYFFVPQVGVSGSGEFFWLSASRPISGAGTTPFPAGFTDLQTWIRNSNLDPDWLRVGTDVVGGTSFNAAFELDGTTVPEPTSVLLMIGAVPLLLRRVRKS